MSVAVAANSKLSTDEALAGMEELLRSAASGGTQHRLMAVRYTEWRSALLASEVKAGVPGFLIQCVTVDKFNTFITLLDPKLDARLQFLDAAFAKCRAMLASSRVYDVFGEDDDF
jgi:hypothetical protein